MSVANAGRTTMDAYGAGRSIKRIVLQGKPDVG
jgi:hypothetical protein